MNEKKLYHAREQSVGARRAVPVSPEPRNDRMHGRGKGRQIQRHHAKTKERYTP
jgi:hypothetical protein